MVIKLTIQQKKNLLQSYKERESRNYHSVNAINLVNVFGNKKEKMKAKEIKLQIKKQGYVNSEQNDWLYKKGHIHYSKLF